MTAMDWRTTVQDKNAEINRLRAELDTATKYAEAYFDESELLKKQVAKLRASLEECANDLEASVNAEYRDTLDYPSQKRKWERDMEPVIKARAALASEAT